MSTGMPRPSSTTVIGVVRMDRDLDVRAVAGERLVHRVVDDLVDEVVQAARAGRADVHARPLAHGLQALQDLDLTGRVVVLLRLVLRHCAPVL
jgi:hypothetical protein